MERLKYYENNVTFVRSSHCELLAFTCLLAKVVFDNVEPLLSYAYS